MRTFHVHLDVRGALLNYRARDYRGFYDPRTGRMLTAREAKAALLDELSKGRKAIPIGEPCEGFDYSGGGCPGHETEG